MNCFNSRCILQVVFNLFLNFLLGELFQFQVYSPSCFPPLTELLIGWVVSIPGVFFKLFSTCFWTSYWVSCFNSRCILQVVFHLLLNFLLGECFNSRCFLQVVFNLFPNFLLGELFQFQVYSPSCSPPISELLIGWVVSIPGVFSKLFSTSFCTSYLVSCFNSRCILQVVFHLFLNFLLGEVFQFQVYSPSCFQPLSELLIGWVVSIPGVFSKLFSTSFWTSYWVSCFNCRCILQVVFHLFLNFLLGELFHSRCILQVVFNLFLNFLLGELFKFQVYSPSCFHIFLNFLLGEMFQFPVYSPSSFQPLSEVLIGWVVSIPGVFSKLFSTNKKFRNRWKTTWRIHLELEQLTQ